MTVIIERGDGPDLFLEAQELRVDGGGTLLLDGRQVAWHDDDYGQWYVYDGKGGYEAGHYTAVRVGR